MSRKTLSRSKPAADPSAKAAATEALAELAPAATSMAVERTEAAVAYRAALEDVLRAVTNEGVSAEAAIGDVRRIARAALAVGAKS